jgi:sulfite exporter TauE/SafE
MGLLAQIAETVFWFALWLAIPAVLLYPVAVWMLKHTDLSANFVTQAFGISIAVLFLPTGVLVDFLYRRFIRKNPPSN